MSESVPNRFNPMGFDIVNGGTQVEPTEGVVIYANNDATGTIVSSATYISYVSIGLGGVGNGMVVYNNGSAFEVNINDGGTMIVSSGGSADYVYINDNSTLIVKSGGIVTHAVEDGAANAIIDIEPGGSLVWD